MVYAQAMKRLQILIDEELDAELDRVAAQTGRSKGALVRDAVRRQLKPLPPLEQDPLWELAGAASFDPVPADKIDEVVYDGR